MKRVFFVWIFAVVLAAGFSSAPTVAAAEEIIITGSTTVLPVMQKAGEAFMHNNPSISLSISGSGSSNGIKALTDGLCQVAMSSRDMKAGEIEAAQKKGVEPHRISIAHDAIIPVVHPGNPVENLTVQQLRDIYAGKITNWKEVGGKDATIVVIARDTSSGTYESWGELVMAKERVSPRALQQASNGAVVTAVAQNERALGYIGFGYVNKNVKSLHVDGKTASPKAVVAKEWPISRELYLFTNGQPEGAVKQLVDYILDPQKGQKSVEEVGYVPL